jgi:UDP-glucose 4-epimerase
MRVLVTGAFGFVGRGVVRQLLGGGHQVLALQSPWSTTEPRLAPGLTVARADLRDKQALAEALSGVEGVCHLGARTRVRESFEDPVGYYDTNLGGTIALLDAIRQANLSTEAPRVVFGSTAAVYGLADAYPVTEQAPLRPTNPYSASKAAAEALIGFTAQAGDIGATILRFANAAGAVDGFADPDQSRIIPKVVAVAAGRFPHVDVNGDGSARREYVHVLDIADACVQALTGAADEAVVLNVGSGCAASIAEVIAAASDVTGQVIPTIHHPPSPEPPLVFSDNTLALTHLGWKPKRSDLTRMISDAWTAEEPC